MSQFVYMRTNRRVPGMHWCSDSELDTILSAVAPFLHKGAQTSVPSMSCSEHEHDVIALDHQDVRAAVVFRYVRLQCPVGLCAHVSVQ